MKTLISTLSALSIVLCAFQAQALYCSELLDNKVDTQPASPIEDTAALREAKVMEELGYLDRAIEALERRLAPKEPGSKELLITLEENSHLAKLYMADHQYRKAISRSLYALEYFKPTDGGFAGLRKAYRSLYDIEGGNNLNNALQVAQAHIKFNPNNYNAHKAVIRLLIELQRPASELLPIYERLHTLAKEQGMHKAQWKALKDKIQLLIDNGRIEEALRDLARYTSSERSWGHRKTTQIYMWLRQFDKAIESADLEIAITELKAPAPYLQKIESLIALRRFSEAIKIAESIKGNFPKHEAQFSALILQAQYEHSEF